MSPVRDPTDETEGLLAHARVHARTVADDVGVDLDRVAWAVSARAKRRAGACRYDRDAGTTTVVLSRRAYRAFDRDEFEAVVRHELLHAWQFQRFGEADHGPRFRERAAEFDVSVRCDAFAEPRYLLRCANERCDWRLARHRASAPVKTPERYRCGECGADLHVEHVESGRIWHSAGGYGGTKATLGDDW